MTEVPPPAPAEPAGTGDASPAVAAAAKPARPAPEPHHLTWPAVAVFALALLFGAWGAWRTFGGGDDPRAALQAAESRVQALEQQVATLTRSDQISRDANRDLQATMAERDEEVAGLRADVAFYERFVGATGQRRGLAVHELRMQPQGGPAWHFTATLTQNLNRGEVSNGQLTLSIEGTRDGRLQRLAWQELRQQPQAKGTDYSFKYFQQVEGDVLLPEGFQPLRVIVRLAGAGSPVEQSFTWADATARSAPGA